ncbi:Glutamate decarboxylase [Fusobacterium sp. DD29]|uniref:glutamate decarboxylase n=1 Tax=unclassified Fusobacterium TaxID=2648384 RepID=UPI001B8AEFD8|nr:MULTISPECIES: glutamate decarboxylase [unclassified Fusobacterium]MBR8749394.1 Glutamate decarboxylase [Fusobacterium sp. DD29]MBR8761643.1 Glutamate decarboxylase [Fusobacterium sp. DD25]MBR8767673.1 Glutamate decarboxylase [Fusobacterium sp. DD43]MBR8771696.1 Glutamate decarboxylase [Fusobacterium sp. DD40]MBR8775949.1 Glutamate decarboxylase [Fusobacterium sp. DD17]
MSVFEKKNSCVDSIFASSEAVQMLPRKQIPKKELDPKVAFELIRDELFLDGNARQNLATFCQTYEDEEVRKLMDLSINKNMIDKDEYPQTAALEGRCVNILANLWHAPDVDKAIGTSTVGSSEACMLGGLAMYYRWREKREKEGKDYRKPNLVCGPVQVCWEKFARYWDIELRQVPMEKDRFYMDAKSMLEYIDENTIGVVTTLGLTFTSMYEPVDELIKALDKLEEDTGLTVDLHVDGASGGFLAPFCAPEVNWDFKNPRVKSISTSGHKFGLAPLGCGWVLWRDKSDLPERLIFHVNYLGGDMPVFQLNFSRPAGQIIAQYYNFLRLGEEGYRKIHMNCYKTAQYLAKEIGKMGIFEVIYDGDEKKGIPALCWKLKEGAEVNFNLYDFADKLRSRGWQVPAYSLPANAQEIVIQRILVRRGVGLDLAELLIEDMKRTLEFFKTHRVLDNLSEKEAGSFNHNGK